MILNVGSKWDGKTVWDCAQFTKSAWAKQGIVLVSGATSQWNKTDWLKKGTINDLPADTVCSLFRESNGKMQHTGLYVGNNTVIHAKGTKYGVIRDTLENYAWTHYAVPKTQNNDVSGGSEVEIINRAIVTAENGKPVRMREAASTKAEVIFAIDCGTAVDLVDIVGEWAYIKFRGRHGYMMLEYLKIDGTQSEEEKDDGLYLYKKIDEHEKRIVWLENKLKELLGAEG